LKGTWPEGRVLSQSLDEDEWSFVIKLQALMDAACTYDCPRLGRKELELSWELQWRGTREGGDDEGVGHTDATDLDSFALIALRNTVAHKITCGL